MKFVLAYIMIFLIFVTGCASPYNRGTYDLYLIPDGYEGTIRVIYNVEGAPALQREGKYDIIPVDRSGTYETSTPMYDYGEVIDQYYYVDEEGNRTEIDLDCVNIVGTGGSQIDGVETRYTTIEVTHTACGNDFRSQGSRR